MVEKEPIPLGFRLLISLIFFTNGFFRLQSPLRTMKFTVAIPFILGAALQAFAQVSDANKAADLVADLKRAPTQVARLNILKDNRDVSTQSRSPSLDFAADRRI